METKEYVCIGSTLAVIQDFYQIKPGILGKGSFGVVLAANRKIRRSNGTEVANKRLKRTSSFGAFGNFGGFDLAIKVFDERLFDDPVWGMTLDNEIRILERIKGHPNIVNFHLGVYDLMNKRGYIVYDRMQMDLLSFHSYFLKQGLRIRPSTAKEIIYNILSGLAHMHEKGVRHLDLKPANVLINANANDVRICDFGMSQISEVPELVRKTLVTVNYRAPELLCAGGQCYTEAVDIWSAGCILAELMTGIISLFPMQADDARILWARILMLLGPPDEAFLESFTDSNLRHELRAIADKSPNRIPTLHLFRHYMEDTSGYDLLTRMLCYSNRISAREAMAHEFFDEIRNRVKCQTLLGG